MKRLPARAVLTTNGDVIVRDLPTHVEHYERLTRVIFGFWNLGVDFTHTEMILRGITLYNPNPAHALQALEHIVGLIADGASPAYIVSSDMYSI